MQKAGCLCHLIEAPVEVGVGGLALAPVHHIWLPRHPCSLRPASAGMLSGLLAHPCPSHPASAGMLPDLLLRPHPSPLRPAFAGMPPGLLARPPWLPYRRATLCWVTSGSACQTQKSLESATWAGPVVGDPGLKLGSQGEAGRQRGRG